jgi:ATP synthase protein I
MGDDPADPSSGGEAAFVRQVAAKAARKLSAQRGGQQGVWFGLGMTGLIGWSVAVPTVLGAMLGVWCDRRHPGAHSWTLMLLAAGLFVGCANAWHWISQEGKSMHVEPEAKDE